jgi:hypothetical protein
MAQYPNHPKKLKHRSSEDSLVVLVLVLVAGILVAGCIASFWTLYARSESRAQWNKVHEMAKKK